MDDIDGDVRQRDPSPDVDCMTYVLIGLGVFWTAKQIDALIDAPVWFWPLAKFSLSLGGLALSAGLDKWYAAFGIAGGVWFLDRLDDLAMVKGDELAKRVLQRR